MWFTPLLGGGQQQLPEVPGILRIPNTLTSQPQTAPQIDWGNPITRKLFDWQAGPWLNGFTPVNSPTRLNSYKGIAQSVNSASSQYLTKTLPNAVSGQFTMVVLCKSPTTGGSEAFISMCQPGATNWVTVEEYVGRYWVWRQGQYSGQQSGALLTVDANWHVHVGVLGDTLAYYRDGIRYGGGEVFTSGTYTTLRIGNTEDASGPVRSATADIALGLFFNRPLSPAEVWSISQNPWQVFQAPQKKIFTFPGIDVTTRPIADVSRVVDTPIFRKPRIKKLPSSATPLNLSHPILRGLEQGIIAGPVRNATSRNQYTVRTSIPGAAPFGRGEKLSGSTGHISAPTSNTSGTDSWTTIFYGVIPSVGTSQALTAVAESPGADAVDKGLFVDSAGKIVAGVFDQTASLIVTATSIESVTSGRPFIAAAVGTSSSINCWLNDKKISASTLSSGYSSFSSPEYVVGYGSIGNRFLTSGAIIAYTLKLNRAITDAEWNSLVQDPWQIFQQVEKPTIVHRAPDIDVRKTPLFFAPSRKKFPSDSTPLNLGHPILRGLEQGIIAGPVRNATTRNQYTVRTSIPAPAPFGVGERLSGSTGYISAPTSISSPWTYIVYGVVPSTGADCALLGIANGPGSGTYDRSLSLSASGAAQARIYNPPPYSYGQITTTTKTVTPGVPFIAAAVATGSELIAYLDYNKVSAAAVSAGYNVYAAPVLIAGYGGPGQTTSSNATIAYALKLNRAITDAEWNSLVQDPWQIFMPGVKRVLALPTFVSPWTSNISNESLYDDIDDTSTNDGDYIISSPATSGVVGDPVIFNLSKTLPQGTHTVRARAKKSATLGEVRAALLDSNNLPVGTSAWQPLSNTFRTYELAITTTGSASRVKFDTVGSSVSTGIPSDGLVLYYDASNTLSYPGSGTTITDLSGRKNNGTLVNGPVFSSENGGSIRFDGTNDYIVVPRPPELVNGGSITVAFWARWVTTGTTVSTIQVLLDNNHSGSPNQGFVLQDRPDLSKSLTFSVNVGVSGAQSTFQVGDGTWRHIVGTNDQSTTRLYIDGVLNAQASQAGLNVVQPNLSIGYWQFTPGRYLNGRVSEVLIYNRALSASEVLQTFNATKGRFQTYSTPNIVTNGLVLRLDAANTQSYPGTGTTWTDLSGFNNHMTIVGSPAYSSTEGFTFDGTVSKYIIRNPITMPTTTISYEIWVKTTDSGSGIISYNTTGVDNAWLLIGPTNLGLYVNPNSNSTGLNIATGTWKQVVLTSNRSTGEEIIYVNGVVAYTGTLSAGITLASGGSLVLAQEQDSVGGGFSAAQAFDGNIASFNLYNRILTTAEVLQNFNALRDRFGI